MSGFFICTASSLPSLAEAEAKYCSSLEVFERKGLSLDRRLSRDGVTVWRYRKYMDAHEHIIEFPNGDFVLNTGTLLYDGKNGLPALASLYEDFVALKPIECRLSGNYAVAIYAQKKLVVFSDYTGYYPIYCNSGKTIFSNSFMAVARAVRATTPRVQEFFEYLLFGFFVGEETLFDDVQVLNSRNMWIVLPSVQQTGRLPTYDRFAVNTSLGSMVERIAGDLCDYFRMLIENFNGHVGLALSGGYDTRLMLAVLRRLGQAPYLFVYGGPESADVTVAKTIAAGEGMVIEHVDKGAHARVSPDEFAAAIEHQVYFFDGIKPLGIIDDGSDFATRLDRARKATLQLNGAGGEIYREVWNMPDCSIDLVEFLRMRFDRRRYHFCLPSWNVDEFFFRVAEKVQRTLGIDRSWITRRDAEMLFPFLRNLLASANNAANNQISYSLVPFMESRFIFPSFDIPIRYKYCGEFQAKLIKLLDPKLAGYRSAYGINFCDAVPMWFRLLRGVQRHIPHKVRLLKRRVSKAADVQPYYHGESYLGKVVSFSNLRISQFVDIRKIDDAQLLSRALSIELLLSHL